MSDCSLLPVSWGNHRLAFVPPPKSSMAKANVSSNVSFTSTLSIFTSNSVSSSVPSSASVITPSLELCAGLSLGPSFDPSPPSTRLKTLCLTPLSISRVSLGTKCFQWMEIATQHFHTTTYQANLLFQIWENLLLYSTTVMGMLLLVAFSTFISGKVLLAPKFSVQELPFHLYQLTLTLLLVLQKRLNISIFFNNSLVINTSTRSRGVTVRYNLDILT